MDGDIESVMVDGSFVMRDHTVLTMDETGRVLPLLLALLLEEHGQRDPARLSAFLDRPAQGGHLLRTRV